jgi:hypothetical protein
MMFFWFWRRVNWFVEANVSEKRAVSIFTAEVMSNQPFNQ